MGCTVCTRVLAWCAGLVQVESMSSGLKILPGDVVRLRASMFDGTLQVWVRWNFVSL
jgi:hypothetical protein